MDDPPTVTQACAAAKPYHFFARLSFHLRSILIYDGQGAGLFQQADHISVPRGHRRLFVVRHSIPGGKLNGRTDHSYGRFVTLF